MLRPAPGSNGSLRQGDAFPYPAPEPGVRLTPPESPAPVLNEPRLFGARPGSPIQFAICASGERPMSFAAAKLPPA